jgi:hypothetical protein
MASAIAQLAESLSDPTNVYYSQTELFNGINQSLRMLQATTGFYRERASLHVLDGVAFYDLRTDLDTPTTGYPYAFSVTDTQLLYEIQNHLLEPPTNPWTGTLQFSVQSIARSIQRARDQFLSDSGIYVVHSIPFLGMPANGRVHLFPSLLDVRRLGWMDAGSCLSYGLVRTDERAALYRQSWPQTPGFPFSYSVAVSPITSVQLIPPPSNMGALDLCSVNTGPDLPCNPSSPVPIGVPDDFAWGVKYQALADLLSEDGPASDPARAQYCRQLYNFAVSLARTSVSIMLGRIGDIETPIHSINDADRYKTSWQNRTPAVPRDIIQVSPNLIAVSPTPDNTYVVTFDLVRSIPVPISTGSVLPITPDLLEPVLDLAQHIVSIKMAGTEFQSTYQLRDNFLRMAALINGKLSANIVYKLLLEEPATRQNFQVPRVDPSSGTPTGAPVNING